MTRLTDLRDRAIRAANILSPRDAATIADIITRASRFGDVTDKQAAFVESLLARTEAQETKRAAIDLTRINQMFNDAAKQLKKPFVNFTIEGAEFRVSQAPMTGKNPGCLYVKAGADYAGKIDFHGAFTAAHNMSSKAEAIQDALSAFAADPAAAATAYGRATGSCCFCARELKDPVSVELGYGPICASRWGLPHRVTKKLEVA